VVLVIALLATTSPLFAAPRGTAEDFLERANRLKAKGPLALFDGDYRRLKSEAYAAGKSIGDDRIAMERAGRKPLYCSPGARAKLGQSEFLGGLEAIPPTQRARISLKAAMLRILQRKYPCR
jgi:hypothetical protein